MCTNIGVVMAGLLHRYNIIIYEHNHKLCSYDHSLQFEQENEQLFSEMNSMVDEVRQIEGKVLEISRLQEIFTEKVLVQVSFFCTMSTVGNGRHRPHAHPQ